MGQKDLSKLDLSALKGLSEAERKFALQLLQEYASTGYSKTYEDLRYQDFEEIPVDIGTFLHDRKYLGNGLYDADGRFTLYPYWEEKLKEIFPDNVTTAYNTVVLTGAIGLGKSLVAVVILLYMLYRLLCLKDPYVYYGLQSIDKLSISFMNITIENAKGVALDKLNQFILASEWFLAHGEMGGKSNLVFRPNKHIELIAASSNNQIIGRCLFCLRGDTIIRTVDGDKTLEELNGKTTKVWSLNASNELILSEPCTIQATVKTQEEYEIELEDGYVIHCTPNHRFLLLDGTYKTAEDLTEDDELFDYDVSYEYFIENIIKHRGQWNISSEEYFEKHHIIPKCLGGSDSRQKFDSNIIYLYPYEHYIAHKLLCKKYPDNRKLKYALHCFNQFNHKNAKRNITFDEHEYNEYRELALKNRGGYHWSQEAHDRNVGKVAARAKAHPEQFQGWNHTNKMCITNNTQAKYINVDDKIPEGWRRGLPKHRQHIIKDIESYKKQKSAQMSGNRNNMYGQGHKIAGSKNGKAIYTYTFDGIEYGCRKDLLEMLQQMWPTVGPSTIRGIMKNPNSLRLNKAYPDIIKKLSWRLKDEN